MLHSLPTKYRLVRSGENGCLYCDEPDAPKQVWQAFNGAVPKGYKVVHGNGFTRCVNPEHLSISSIPPAKPKPELKPRAVKPPKAVVVKAPREKKVKEPRVSNPLYRVKFWPVGDEMLTYTECIARSGASKTALLKRMADGMTMEEAVAVGHSNHIYLWKGEFVKMSQLVEISGFNRVVLHGRLSKGSTLEEAMTTPPGQRNRKRRQP